MDERTSRSLEHGARKMTVNPEGKEDFHIRYWNCTNSKCQRLRRFYVWSVDEEYWIRRCSQGHQLRIEWTTREKMNAHMKRVYIPVIKKSLENSLAFYRRLDGPGPYELRRRNLAPPRSSDDSPYTLGPGKGFTIPVRYK